MTLIYNSRSSDTYTFYVDVPLSLGCIIRKVSAEDIAIRGNGTGLEYTCPTRHFVYIFFNPVFQLSTAKNEINLFNNHVLIVAPVTLPQQERQCLPRNSCFIQERFNELIYFLTPLLVLFLICLYISSHALSKVFEHRNFIGCYRWEANRICESFAPGNCGP